MPRKSSIRTDRIMDVPGFLASAVRAGIKKKGGDDLGLILSENPASVAGVFTRNAVKAAPVIISQNIVKRGKVRAILVNSGCANACTGKKGIRDAELICNAQAKELRIKGNEILPASTGVIGEYLPVKKILKKLPSLRKSLSRKGLSSVASAMMTTDSFPKMARTVIKIGRGYVTIAGIAKGAGMIQPDMATMLCFLLTDASISPPLLRRLLKNAVSRTFNRITVDGDMSTNDTVLILANGASNIRLSGKSQLQKFLSALTDICSLLAVMIVSDGEGTTRAVEIRVKGASSHEDAKDVAYKTGNSPLVKTAIFGCDPNWGRLVAAAGASGARINPDRLQIYFDNVQVVRNGIGTGNEKSARKVMQKKNYTITIDLKSGRSSYSLLTSDLTHDYIRINSSYRS